MLGLPCRADRAETTISGADVPKPTTTMPISSGGMPKWPATAAAPSIKRSALQSSRIKPQITAAKDSVIVFGARQGSESNAKRDPDEGCWIGVVTANGLALLVLEPELTADFKPGQGAETDSGVRAVGGRQVGQYAFFFSDAVSDRPVVVKPESVSFIARPKADGPVVKRGR